ncbi:hypothetical protein GF357_03105 [Candidatus Dojkabacteria bacterium]|nr:hypothetical protein [Candidatus Dojkabacteria bacterium]
MRHTNITIPKIYALYALTTTLLVPFQFGAATFLLLAGWNILTIIAYNITKSKSLRKFIITISIIYPIIEMTIKFLIFRNIIPFSYWWLNSIEHSLFAIFTTTLLSISLINSSLIKTSLLTALTSIGIFNVVGILNEILEFGIRLAQNLEKIGYYYDTLRDLIINLAMSTLTAIIIMLISSKLRSNEEKPHNSNRRLPQTIRPERLPN